MERKDIEQLIKHALPSEVFTIFDTLESKGFETYLVGGSVRDMCFNAIFHNDKYARYRNVHDFDFATAALPEEIIEVFKNYEVIPTGLKHGTVTVRINHQNFEITTFRIDGKYDDFRHPDSVSFTRSIEEDLSRRDFTMNAIAYSPTRGLVDPFDGIGDLDNIRCVGDPTQRFREDPLRILRASRFALQFMIPIEITTYEAAQQNVNLIHHLSKERVTDEFKKMLNIDPLNITYSIFRTYYGFILEEYFPTLKEYANFRPTLNKEPQIWNKYLRIQDHQVNVFLRVKYLYPMFDFALYIAALCHDLGKKNAETVTLTDDKTKIYHYYRHPEESLKIFEQEVLPRLSLSNREIDEVRTLILYHDMRIAPTKKSVKKALQKMSPAMLSILFKLQEADLDDHNFANLLRKKNTYRDLYVAQYIASEIHKDIQECFTIKQLKINGRDLLKLGIEPGPKIGKILRELLQKVIEEEIQNDPKSLLQYAQYLAGSKE